EIPMISLNDFEDKDEKNYGLNGSPTQVLKIFPPTSNVEKETWTGEEVSSLLLNKIKELKLI
ncbi:MAG: electron transfer flavoprotein subunit beta, partial [Paraclostridium bifermentans]